MATPKKKVANKSTERFIPCAGNFLQPPNHGMPVFCELLRTNHAGGNLFARCGVCGHNGFWTPETLRNAYTRDGARATIPKNAGTLPPVDGMGRPL